MIEREKLQEMDRKYASWLIEVAKTKDMADEVIRLCDEIMRDIEKDGDTAELIFEDMYLNPVKISITEFMSFVEEGEKFVEKVYDDTEARNDG